MVWCLGYSLVNKLVIVKIKLYSLRAGKKMTDPREKAVKWLKNHRLYKGNEFSELGKTVAWFLDELWGLYHINRISLFNVDWHKSLWIEITISVSERMSTVDNDDLTRLVVIAHQMMLRVELNSVGPGFTQLVFHQRSSRGKTDGIISVYCPDITNHVNEICKQHPSVEQIEIQRKIDKAKCSSS